MNFKNFCKVLAKIEANPSCWDQQSFFDNCFVGLAADMAGCSRCEQPTWRHKRGAKFLGVSDNCPEFGAVGLTLDHFRRIRHVAATQRLHAMAA